MKINQRGFIRPILVVLIVIIVIVSVLGWRFVAEFFAPNIENKILSQLVDPNEGSVINRYERLLSNSGDYTTTESKDFFSNTTYLIEENGKSTALNTIKGVEQVKIFGFNLTPQYALIKLSDSKYNGKFILYKINGDKLNPLTINGTVFEQAYNSNGGGDLFKVYIDLLGDVYVAGSMEGTNSSKLYNIRNNIVNEISGIEAKNGSISVLSNNKGEFYIYTYGQQSDGKYKARDYFIKDGKSEESSSIGNYTDEKGNWYEYDYDHAANPFSVYPSRLYRINGTDKQLVKRKGVTLCFNFHGDLSCRNNLVSEKS